MREAQVDSKRELPRRLNHHQRLRLQVQRLLLTLVHLLTLKATDKALRQARLGHRTAPSDPR